MLVAFFVQMLLALKQFLGCKDVGCKPYCSDVIEHKVGKRCSVAYC